MPDPVGTFYTGTYDDGGDTEALSAQNVDTEAGVAAVQEFVAGGLAAHAPTITLTKQ